MGGRGGSGRSSAAGATISKPSEAFGAAPTSSADPALEAIQQAMMETPESNRQLISLLHARMRMADRGIVRREDQDRELLRLFRARRILLVPYSNQKVMSRGDRDAEISIGNERKGAVMMG